MTPGELFATAYRLGRDPEVARVAEAEIDAWFRRVAPREIVEVAAAARVSFKHGLWAGYVPLNAPIAPARLTQAAPSTPVALAALCSLHRSGYLREIATATLAEAEDDRVIPFLLLRTDDIVEPVRAIATRAVEARLQPQYASAFARSLRVVELLRARTRGGGGPVVRLVSDFLGQPGARDALAAASRRDDDAVTRLAAFKLRSRVEPIVAVLAEALADRDTRIRQWAARTAISRATNEADRRELVPVLAASRSAWTRMLALRARERLDPSDGFLEAALLDPHAAVRYLARTLLRTRHPSRAFSDTREHALAVLSRADASTDELVGALGALSDVGLPGDADEASRFTGDERPRVRAEASRTLALLRTC